MSTPLSGLSAALFDTTPGIRAYDSTNDNMSRNAVAEYIIGRLCFKLCNVFVFNVLILYLHSFYSTIYTKPL